MEYYNVMVPKFAENQEDGYKVSDERRTHILDGDEHGNGHGPNRGKTKGSFPDTWTDNQVIAAVERVANDPNSIWTQTRGSGMGTVTVGGPRPDAPTHTSTGTRAKFKVIWSHVVAPQSPSEPG